MPCTENTITVASLVQQAANSTVAGHVNLFQGFGQLLCLGITGVARDAMVVPELVPAAVRRPIRCEKQRPWLLLHQRDGRVGQLVRGGDKLISYLQRLRGGQQAVLLVAYRGQSLVFFQFAA